MKRLEFQITQTDKKLNKLYLLEQKVSSFDTDLEKLWVFIQDKFGVMSEVSESIDTLEFSLWISQEQITQLSADLTKIDMLS